MDEIALRDSTLDDVEVLFQQQLDPVAAAMADFPPRDHEAYVAHWHQTSADPANRKTTVLVGEQIAGGLVAWWQDGKREIGYWYGREFWGRGIATAALTAFLELETVRPLHAEVSPGNAGSRRVLLRCGFAEVGTAADGFIEFRLG